MEYPNFFENRDEATIRLQNTVVMFGPIPVEIVALADHLKDGNIYAYIRPIGSSKEEIAKRPSPDGLYNIPMSSSTQVGMFMDEWIKNNPNGQIERAPLSAWEFNKFRPFELGMYWNPPHLYYVERQPNRKTNQGLINTMLVIKQVGLGADSKTPIHGVDMYGPEMLRCIRGEHPAPKRCIEALTGSKYANEAGAFHRHFAFIRGPVDTLFLNYKTNVVGVLPHGDLSQVRLARDFAYTKEVVDELHLFEDIRINN